MEQEKVFAMKLSKIYPLLTAKAERKGRTRQEVDRGHLLADRIRPGGPGAAAQPGHRLWDLFPGGAPDEPQLREDHRDRLRRPGGGDR